MSKLKEARLAAGLSQVKMSELTEIPVRTIQDWESGRRKCMPWAERLILKELDEIRRTNVEGGA